MSGFLSLAHALGQSAPSVDARRLPTSGLLRVPLWPQSWKFGAIILLQAASRPSFSSDVLMRHNVLSTCGFHNAAIAAFKSWPSSSFLHHTNFNF